MKIDIIRSRRHPGATFLKVHDSHDLFIAKFYPGQDRAAHWFKELIEGLSPEEEAALKHFGFHPINIEVEEA